jgi:hypothetical protein
LQDEGFILSQQKPTTQGFHVGQTLDDLQLLREARNNVLLSLK